MSAPSALAAVFAPIALIGIGLIVANTRGARLPESAQVALDAVRKTALRQLVASWKLQSSAFLAMACLAAFGGLSRGNGWILSFVVVPVAGALSVGVTWACACAVLGKAGHQLVGARTERTASDLARTALGVTLVAQVGGAALGLGLGSLDVAYGIRLGDWAASGVALSALFVALAAATLEPLTLNRSHSSEASPTNLGAAAVLSIVRPMRSLIVVMGLSMIALDRLARSGTSADPARSEASTYLLLVLGGSALATLFGGLAVRSEEHETVAQAFRRGTRSSLVILAACIWLARGQDASPLRTQAQAWALCLFAVGTLTFFSYIFRSFRSRLTLPLPAVRLLQGSRVPFVVGVGFLVTQTFEPNLDAASILFAVFLGAAPIAVVSAVAADCRRGATHLAWLVLHPSAAEGAVEDKSLEDLPPVESWLFGACLMLMGGPSLGTEPVPLPLGGAMILLGTLAMAFTLAVHRQALESPMRESERIVSAQAVTGAFPLNRAVELGEKVMTRAGLPLIVFLGVGSALALLAQSPLLPTSLSAPAALGLWTGALLIGVGASGYLSSEPLSTRASLGPLALTLTLTLGALLSGVQSIVL